MSVKEVSRLEFESVEKFGGMIGITGEDVKSGHYEEEIFHINKCSEVNELYPQKDTNIP